MTKLFPKRWGLAILIGLVFLLGGASFADAAEEWTFTFRMGATGALQTSTIYPTEQGCNTIRNGLNTGGTSVTVEGQCALPVAPLTPPEIPDSNLGGLTCGLTTFTQCLPIWTYYLVYKPASLALTGTGIIFDKILDLSINNGPSGMVSPPFISKVWIVVRDFSNMIFIFILLYTGIMTMFGAADWRKVVLQVVFIALLINFSLFFTKVVIDAGNILAMGIKSSIQGASISSGLTSSFEPQKFLNMAGNVKPMDAIIVFLVAAAVSGFAAYVFFKAALLFAGRLIAFWFLMIISPFAFISTTLPKGNKFQEWFDTLLAQAFVAPVFLFFIYIIMMVVNTRLLDDFLNQGSTWFEKLIGPVIVATLLIIALQQALKFAEGMAGAFGKLGSDMVGGVMGVAAGVATGGAAMVAQKTIGRGALAMAGSEKFKEFTSKSAVGRTLYNLTDKTAGATFDARNIPGAGKLGLGKGGAGSFVKTTAETKKGELEFIKKVSTGKDGKPIMTEVDEWTTGPSGERVKTGRKVAATVAEARAEKLTGGTIVGAVTGRNVGAKQAGEDIKKKEDHRQKQEEKKEKLEAKHSGAIADFKKQLKIPEESEIDSEEATESKEKIIEELETALEKAEAELEYVKTTLPGDTDAHALAAVNRRKATKALRKFEDLQKDIEKTKKELDKIQEEKDKEKKEEKGEKKEEKH